MMENWEEMTDCGSNLQKAKKPGILSFGEFLHCRPGILCHSSICLTRADIIGCIQHHPILGILSLVYMVHFLNVSF
jgi:hypothetical protein